MELDFIKIASIIKTHGFRGNIVIKKDNSISFTQFDKCLKEGNAIFISIDGIPIPFFIEKNSIDFINEQIVHLKLDNLDNLESAKTFINNDVYLTRDCIDSDLVEDLSPTAWINFKIIDTNYGLIGSVLDFDNIPKNPLLIIERNGKELMIPLNGNLISSVDIEKKEILTDLPEGYLDLYN